MGKLAANTYGEALFSLAMEENKVDALYQEAKIVIQALEENTDFVKLLTHPQITKEEKARLMEEVFKGKVMDELTGLMNMAVLKGHSKEIAAILTYFTEQVKEYKKIGTAYVTTAAELNDKQKADTVAKLIQTTPYVEMEMHYAVDTSLIGGMVIRIGDRVVDSSIKTKLNDLAKVLVDCDLDYNALGI